MHHTSTDRSHHHDPPHQAAMRRLRHWIVALAALLALILASSIANA